MTSPARRHFLQETAKQETEAQTAQHLSTYQRLQFELRQDKAVLKQIESIKDKAIAKAEMLPKYAAWVNGVLENPNPDTSDEVFATAAIWLCDTGELSEAARLALFTVEHGMQATDEYQRTLSTILFEQIAEQLIAGYMITESRLSEMIKAAESKQENGQHEIDMPDQVRAKFFKAAGVFLTEHGNKDQAAVLLEKAISYDERVGAKQLLKELRASLNE